MVVVFYTTSCRTCQMLANNEAGQEERKWCDKPANFAWNLIETDFDLCLIHKPSWRRLTRGLHALQILGREELITATLELTFGNEPYRVLKKSSIPTSRATGMLLYTGSWKIRDSNLWNFRQQLLNPLSYRGVNKRNPRKPKAELQGLTTLIRFMY